MPDPRTHPQPGAPGDIGPVVMELLRAWDTHIGDGGETWDQVQAAVENLREAVTVSVTQADRAAALKRIKDALSTPAGPDGDARGHDPASGPGAPAGIDGAVEERVEAWRGVAARAAEVIAAQTFDVKALGKARREIIEKLVGQLEDAALGDPHEAFPADRALTSSLKRLRSRSAARGLRRCGPDRVTLPSADALLEDEHARA